MKLHFLASVAFLVCVVSVQGRPAPRAITEDSERPDEAFSPQQLAAARAKGKARAARLIEKGVLTYHGSRLGPGDTEFREALKRKGITSPKYERPKIVDLNAFALFVKEQLAFMQHMHAEINRRFGEDFITRTEAEAKKLYDEKQQRKNLHQGVGGPPGE